MQGIMNLSVKEIEGEILIVSQFTLHASTKKGNRPSYIKASKPEFAVPLYEIFIKEMEKEIPQKIKTGIFGADMKISLTNNGPVTILIDTKNKE
jgi:D-tyrosyl-tRNA(Tyr) deacylase